MHISTKEVRAMINSGKDIYLVDVRDKLDYEMEHIQKSINIPLDILSFEAEEFLKNKSRYIIVYSNSDKDCETATDILNNNGYSNVFSMGSYQKWIMDAHHQG